MKTALRNAQYAPYTATKSMHFSTANGTFALLSACTDKLLPTSW